MSDLPTLSHPDGDTANRLRATENVPALHRSAGRGVSVALAAAATLFVLYPAVRPFSDETSLQGATAFASTSWLVAHTVAMAAFLLLALGLLGLHLRLQGTPAARRSRRALTTSWIGVGLILPFYGAETFGLAAIGQHVAERSDPSLLAIAEAVRLGPGIVLLAAGLLLLATGAAIFAAAIWKAEGRPRWSGYPAGRRPRPLHAPVPRSAAGPHRPWWPHGTRMPPPRTDRNDRRLSHERTEEPLMATATVRTLRTIFWDDTQGRARVPWLILIPLIGAFVAASADTLVPIELPLPVAALLASGVPVMVAVLLVMFSRRFLGGRTVADYGLSTVAGSST